MRNMSDPSAYDIFPPSVWFVSLGYAVPRGVHSSPWVHPLDRRCTFLSFLHVIPHAASTPRVSSPLASRTGTAPPCVQPRPSRPHPSTSTRHSSRSPTLLPLRYHPFLPHAPDRFPFPFEVCTVARRGRVPLSLPLSLSLSLSLPVWLRFRLGCWMERCFGLARKEHRWETKRKNDIDEDAGASRFRNALRKVHGGACWWRKR